MPIWVANYFNDYLGRPCASLLSPFVRYPFLAFLVSIFFFYVAVKKNKPFALLASFFWIFYGIWESCMWLFSDSIKIPGRADLYLLSPGLISVTMIACVVIILRK